jgi:hypothetical protein
VEGRDEGTLDHLGIYRSNTSARRPRMRPYSVWLRDSPILTKEDMKTVMSSSVDRGAFWWLDHWSSSRHQMRPCTQRNSRALNGSEEACETQKS